LILEKKFIHIEKKFVVLGRIAIQHVVVQDNSGSHTQKTLIDAEDRKMPAPEKNPLIKNGCDRSAVGEGSF
jgi:hypothetical protein